MSDTHPVMSSFVPFYIHTYMYKLQKKSDLRTVMPISVSRCLSFRPYPIFFLSNYILISSSTLQSSILMPISVSRCLSFRPYPIFFLSNYILISSSTPQSSILSLQPSSFSFFSEFKNGTLNAVQISRPHGAKSTTGGRDRSMDHGEPHWRTNSSFSPPPLSIWDCRLQYDGLPRGSHGAPPHRSSLSSNHHHSVSDGVLSYSDSPPDNFQESRWTSPVKKFSFGESAGGSRSETPWFPRSTKRQYTAGASAASHSFGSPSSLSESGQWEPTSKLSFPNCTFSNRRSFISKPVYSLVYRNPVSDCETFGNADTSSIGRLTAGEDRILPSHWPDNSSVVEHKFHKTLTELQKLETSPDPSASSRRDGFRWSSASSYDMGFDGETFDIDMENLRSVNFPVGDQKCGVCGKLLWQKSPWSSYRIMRGGDMPTAGVLHCSHVFHAECLEQMTPKTQIHDPPCPLCLKTMGAAEESPTVSEPLQVALRSVRSSRGVVITDVPGDQSNEVSNCIKDSWRRNWSQAAPQWNSTSGSLIKNHLKKHFTFKGKISRDIFSTKVFRRTRSSSSSREPVQRQISIR